MHMYSIIFNKTRHCIYKNVAYIAGKKAGLIGLKFFVDTHGWSGGIEG